MKYSITDYKLNDDSHLYYHTNNDNGTVTIVYSNETNLLGTIVSDAQAQEIQSEAGVNSTTTWDVPNVAHRFAHLFNEPKGQYLCYTSVIQDTENTVLYYVLEQASNQAVTFKTNDSNPNGVVISMTEINEYLTNYVNNGIPTVPSNEILRDFGHLLTSIS
jgi:hypothetical protein